MIFEDPLKFRRKWERRKSAERREESHLRAFLGIFLAIAAIAAVSLAMERYRILPTAPLERPYASGASVRTVLRNGAGESDEPRIRKGTLPVPGKFRERTELPAELATIPPLPPIAIQPFLHAAYVSQWNPLGRKDLDIHAKQLDLAFPDLFFWDGAADGCTVTESANWNVGRILRENGIFTMPRFSDRSVPGAAVGFAELIRNPKMGECLAGELKRATLNRSAPGIAIDIGKIGVRDRETYVDWLLGLTRLFHTAGLYVSVSVPVGNEAFDYGSIGQIADFVLIDVTDDSAVQPDSAQIPPGSFFEESLATLFKAVPPSKSIVILETHGYDRNLNTGTRPEKIAFGTAVSIAGNAGVGVRWDAASQAAGFAYLGIDGKEHRVDFPDASSIWNRYLAARRLGARGVSLSRIGDEDPTVWQFYSGGLFESFDPRSLGQLPGSGDIVEYGNGKMYRIRSLASSGERILSFSGRTVVAEEYARLPKNLSVERFAPGKPKTVVLTFHGGPDAVVGDRILEFLRNRGIRSTFFPAADAVASYSGTLHRILADGHLVGNHASWTWGPSGKPVEELESNGRALEPVLGSGIRFASAPEPSFGTPTNAAMAFPSPADFPGPSNAMANIFVAGNLGYAFLPPDIDVRSYGSGPVNAVSDAVISRVKSRETNVIALYDGPGEASRTLEILENIVPKLEAQGYGFLALDEVAGVPRESLMPPMSPEALLESDLSTLATIAKDWFWNFLLVLFSVATAVSIFRIAFLGTYIYRSAAYRKKREFSRKFLKLPPVTILVPAYNESVVITRTIQWLLSSKYPEFEILVIDDGSIDDTSERVKSMMKKHPNVRLITKKNEGKSLALNLGFREAKYDYVITVDADTIVLSDTVFRLMEPFSDESVDAVCGNIGVWNVKNVLTAFQEVEYVTGQNFDRRAFDALNCISVVPGATGAWKKKKVLEVGGYASDTLVEDADLTLTILEHGGRIVYSPLAKSVTEVPEDVRALFKQRFRWSYGTFQCFWKHRKTFGKGTLGIIALPNMLFFQVIFPALSPLWDIVLVGSIFLGYFQPILAAYLLFFLMDAVVTGTAYALDRKSIANIWVIFIQRFFYRQFMYFVTFKSVFAAFRWSHHGWNKLERTGTVEVKEKA